MTGALRDVPRPSVPDSSTITRVLLQVGGSFGTAVLAVVLVTAGGTTASAFHVAFGWAVGLTAVALIPALLMPHGERGPARPSAWAGPSAEVGPSTGAGPSAGAAS